MDRDGFGDSSRLSMERLCHMSASDQAVVDFLTDCGGSAPHKLKVALTMAESMVIELKLSLDEWELTVKNLREIKSAAEWATN